MITQFQHDRQQAFNASFPICSVVKSLLIADRYDRQRVWSVLFADCELKRVRIFLITIGRQQEVAVELAPSPDFTVGSISLEPNLIQCSELDKLVFVPPDTFDGPGQ